ncbi:sulfite exporter TauE/SafE family protein, partial [Octadecabacter sp.]|nr:sulfite exporter TauE/SafE family protein [Octadecabacter sp.]
MEGFAFWSLAVLAAFCVGLSKGGAPAFGELVVPILSLTISPVPAAGLLLPVFVFSDVFGVWAYRKYANWSILRIAVIGIGTGIGWATAHIVSDNFVRVLIGVTFSLYFLLRSRANTQATSAGRTAGLFWTTIAGFTGFVSYAGAPPWQVWVLPQKLPKMVFAGTSTFAFAMMNALKI